MFSDVSKKHATNVAWQKKKIIIIDELKVLRNKRFGFVQLCDMLWTESLKPKLFWENQKQCMLCFFQTDISRPKPSFSQTFPQIKTFF
jgi:hypothetical protein